MNDHLPFFRLPSKHTPLRPDDDDDDTTPLISPMSRIHTAAAHHKRRKRRSVSPQKLLPIQFILVPTMLTRKTKRNFELGGRDRDTPLELQRLSPPRSSTSTSTTRSPEVRSDMLVALIPRTPLEKLLHRRATWLQRWWRRMCNNLWYVRATVSSAITVLLSVAISMCSSNLFKSVFFLIVNNISLPKLVTKKIGILLFIR